MSTLSKKKIDEILSRGTEFIKRPVPVISSQVSEACTVKIGDADPVDLEPGDYLIKEEDGTIKAMPAEEFSLHYKAV